MGYEPDTLPSYIHIRNRSYTIKLKLHFTPGYYFSRPTSWSHHLIIQLDPGIRSSPVHISYIGQQVTYSAMVDCRIWIYSFIVYIPAASSASATGYYSHSPPSVLWAVIPTILRSDRWWKPFNTFIIAFFTTQILLPYSITICAAAL